MRISYLHQYIFISVPKTGTTSIRDYLNKFSDFKEEIHEPMSPFYEHGRLSGLKKEVKLDDFFSFCFVRNPWDKYLSLYFYFKKMIDFWDNDQTKKRDWLPVYFSYKKILSYCSTFSSFCKFNDFDDFQIPRIMTQPQSSWAKEVDFIGRFENLQSDFDLICQRIGLPKNQLNKINKTIHKNYAHYYDDKTRKIIEKKYAEDIDFLNYSFL
jgi:chondroitin 4-sulfotransferase 11